MCVGKAPPPLGSGWLPLLAAPAEGTQLDSPELVAAINKGKTVFFRDELRQLGLTNLTSRDYVFTGTYYRPSTDVRTTDSANGRVLLSPDGSLPETLGSEWIPLLSLPTSGSELAAISEPPVPESAKARLRRS